MFDDGSGTGIRGSIWMSCYHSLTDEARLNPAIFDSLSFDPALVWEYLPSLLHPSQSWRHQPWFLPWEATWCFDTLTV
jgi:hypothetical protein